MVLYDFWKQAAFRSTQKNRRRRIKFTSSGLEALEVRIVPARVSTVLQNPAAAVEVPASIESVSLVDVSKHDSVSPQKTSLLAADVVINVSNSDDAEYNLGIYMLKKKDPGELALHREQKLKPRKEKRFRSAVFYDPNDAYADVTIKIVDKSGSVVGEKDLVIVTSGDPSDGMEINPKTQQLDIAIFPGGGLVMNVNPRS